MISTSLAMARVIKYIKFVFHIALFIVISNFLTKNRRRPIKNIERFMGDMRHILLWTTFNGVSQEGQRMFISKNCEYFNCYLTKDRNLLGDLRYFDAVVFNVEDLERTISDLPSLRSEVQKYIFAANDSADNYPICSSVYENYFNWTWSYRLDSIIPYTHITVYNLYNDELGHNLKWIQDMSPINIRLKSVLQTKSKAAATFLDKCDNTSRKESYLKNLQIELAKYNLTVDIYGKCGTYKCGRRNRNTCYYKLKTKYYFYLAFEDSMAVDFVTNIVLFGYKNNAVPIVFGGADYDRFIPPKSYLDAAKLGESMLAKTMHEIIQNKDSYYDFFRWRNHYDFQEAKGMDFCTLCEVMNNPAWLHARVSYGSFRKWWNYNYEKLCENRQYLLF